MNASRCAVVPILFIVSIVIFISLLWPTSIVSQTSDGSAPDQSLDAPAPEQPEEYQSAMVVLDGKNLFRIAGVEAFPAEERAEKIVNKIIELAEDPNFDPESLEVKEDSGIYKIYAGDVEVLSVFVEDAKLEGDFEPEVMANEFFTAQISQAVENYRYERQSGTLRGNIIKALIRTGLLALVLVLLFWIFRKADKLFEKLIKRRIDKLESQSKKVIQSEEIWNIFKFINRLLRAAFVVFIIYIFLNFVLGLFPWTRQLADTLLSFVVTPVKIIWRSFVDYLPSLFFLVFIYFIFRYILRITRAFFSRVERKQLKISGFESEWAWPTYRIVRIIVILLGLVMAYPYIPGSGSEAFKGISILLGVVFSFGSSSLISNVVAGYTMTYKRAFNVGDRVKFGEHEGEVTDVRLLETTIRSLKNEEIVIPNSTILSGEVVNYSNIASKQGVILHTAVGIGYEVPWRQVEAMLLMAAERTDGLSRKAEHFVLQKALGDFGVTYELNAFCRKPEKMARIYSDLHRNIQDVFNEYGVAIMTPHYVADTDEPKMVPKEKWYAPPAPQSP